MRKELKDKRAVENLAKLLAEINGDKAPKVDAESITRDAATYKPDPSYTADAVITFIQKPARFAFKKCGRVECGEMFGTNYRAVNFCSVNCRIKYLEAQGIKWNPYKKEEERWGGEPPLIIPPDALKVLLKLAQSQSEIPIQSELPLQEVSSIPVAIQSPAELLQPMLAVPLNRDPMYQPSPAEDPFETDPFAGLL
jgi:hypothetical protein